MSEVWRDGASTGEKPASITVSESLEVDVHARHRYSMENRVVAAKADLQYRI